MRAAYSCSSVCNDRKTTVRSTCPYVSPVSRCDRKPQRCDTSDCRTSNNSSFCKSLFRNMKWTFGWPFAKFSQFTGNVWLDCGSSSREMSCSCRYEKSARPVGRTLARVCSMRECKLVIACHQVSTRLLAGRLVLHQTRFVRTVRSIAASA